MLDVKNLSKSFVNREIKQSKLPGHLVASEQHRLEPQGTEQQTSVDDERRVYAVKSVSFCCRQGSILGLLGPNGAGKTTLLRLLSTALSPTSGGIYLNGEDVTQNPMKLRQSIGFLTGKTALYRRLTVRENLRYFGRLHGLSKKTLDDEICKVFKALDIEAFADKRAEDLSTGMSQRASIARCVIHRPQFLILDEPTTGLDILSTKTLLDFIASFQHSETSVIFSTHHLHEVEALCDQLLVLDQGSAVYSGDVNGFKTATSTKNLYQALLSVMHHSETSLSSSTF